MTCRFTPRFVLSPLQFQRAGVTLLLLKELTRLYKRKPGWSSGRREGPQKGQLLCPSCNTLPESRLANDFSAFNAPSIANHAAACHARLVVFGLFVSLITSSAERIEWMNTNFTSWHLGHRALPPHSNAGSVRVAAFDVHDVVVDVWISG